MRSKRSQAEDRIRLWLSAIAVFGILLRFFYVLATPYSVREHDVWSHIDYIEYVAEHHALPDPHAGSQFYHPPLYYLLMAPAYTLFLRWGLPGDEALTRLQIFSFLCSVTAFMLALWIGTLLFRTRAQRMALILFGMLLATAPGLIFFAPRINNDVLAQVFLFASLALLLSWWKRPIIKKELILGVLLALGILTKGTVLILLPIAFLTIPLKRTLSVRRRMLSTSLMVLLLVALTGWFTIPRALSERDARSALIGNVHILTNTVSNAPGAYLTLNPFALLKRPFNDPFNDDARRHNFWEYLLRSALFGEFNFGTPYVILAQMLISAAIVGCIVAFYHLWREVRKDPRETLPIWLTFAVLLLGHTAFRIVYPYSSSQDFRYSILLLIPLSYYAVVGLKDDPPILRAIALTAIGAIILCSTAFLLSISLQTIS